jgi:acylphosphatase
MTTTRIHALYYGRVQGVCFRYFTEKIANLLKLNGTVENKNEGKPDKHVEVFAEGPKDKIKILAKALTYGPSGARVDMIEIHEEPVTGEVGFKEIRPPVVPCAVSGTYQHGQFSDARPIVPYQQGQFNFPQEKVCECCGEAFDSTGPHLYDDPPSLPWKLCTTCYKQWTAIDSDPNYCPTCDKVVVPIVSTKGDKFCPDCGQMIGG